MAAEPVEEAATTSELELDVASLKQSLSQLREEEARADRSEWRKAFGDQAEVTDSSGDEEEGAGGETDDGFGEFVTF